MSDKFAFTVTRIDSLSARVVRYFVYDEKQPGLRLYVTPSGAKTFQFQVRSKTLGKVETRTLGKYPMLNISEAREQAAKLLTMVNAGIDIELEKRDERRRKLLDPTVQDFSIEYIEKYAKLNKKSWKADERSLEVNILPEIGRYKMKDVSRRDLVAIIDQIIDKGSMVMANRVHALLSKFFSFAVERDVIEFSPAYGMKKRSPEQPRARILTDEEIKGFWAALGGSAAEMILRMILITGQRPGEVRQMEWNEIQGDLWTIPQEKTKNGLIHVVPLSPLAMKQLEKMKRRSAQGSIYVFPGRRQGDEILGHRCLADTSAIHTMGKVIKKLGLAEKARPHDLRRTVRSNLAKLGILKEVAERILNHKEQGVSATYDRHDYLQEKRAALLKWEEYLVGIIPKDKIFLVKSIK